MPKGKINDFTDDEIKKLEKKIVDTIVPQILSGLFQSGEISDNDDQSTIRNKLLSGIENDILKDMFVSVIISDTFKDAIEEEIQRDRKNVVVCLAGIYIEQITNEFYQMVLQSKYEFSNKSFDDCMKSVTIRGKLTWLFTLVTSTSLDSELVSKVIEICSARNRVVHYKPIAENIDERKKDEDFDFNEIITVIDRLKDALDDTINQIFPEIEIGLKLYKRLNGEIEDTNEKPSEENSTPTVPIPNTEVKPA